MWHCSAYLVLEHYLKCQSAVFPSVILLSMLPHVFLSGVCLTFCIANFCGMVTITLVVGDVELLVFSVAQQDTSVSDVMVSKPNCGKIIHLGLAWTFCTAVNATFCFQNVVGFLQLSQFSVSYVR